MPSSEILCVGEVLWDSLPAAHLMAGVAAAAQIQPLDINGAAAASGKYVLPGLFDSQNSYSWYFGEAMLNHGVTSTIDVGTTGETAAPYRDAVFHGKARGPRTFTGICDFPDSRSASACSSRCFPAGV